MEVFMRNIPWAVDELQLQRELEPILHNQESFGPFLRGFPYNFLVQLIKAKKKHRKQKSQKHAGYGILVLPRADIGRHLLWVTERKPIVIHGRMLSLQAGRNSPSRDVLLSISGPYQDPEAAEEEARLRQVVAGALDVRTLQFAWPCRDGTLSVEWESRPNDWRIEFNSEDRRITLRSSQRHQVAITLGSILTATTDHNSCVLLLDRPPIFEWERGPGQISAHSALASAFAALSLNNSLDSTDDQLDDDIIYAEDIYDDDNYYNEYDEYDQPPIRDRLSGLNHGDNRLFGYLRVIRMVFNASQGSMDFRSKAKTLGIHAIFDEQRIDRDSRRFHTSLLDRFNRWLSSLDFRVAFQLDALVARCLSSPGELLGIRDPISAAVRQHGEEAISSCIRALEQDLEENWDSQMSLGEMFAGRCRTLNDPNTHTMQRREDVFECHRVMVTATSIIPNGPFPDESNRVIRRYMDNRSSFLRVEFREEDRLHFRWDRNVDGAAFIDKRIGSLLKEGLQVAGRKFEFLAYSSSALKEHAVWFMTPFTHVQEGRSVHITADYIRKSLGDFSKVARCPARYGARLSQAFSATEDSVVLEADEIIMIRDIKSSTGSCHTDGVGTMSPELADEIWEKYTSSKSKLSRRHLRTPSAYQIRLAGYKGMLCVDNRLEGRVICARQSMDKFSAPEHNTIEIARAFDRPMVMYLNRPLIMVLETLGVSLEPFMQLQQDAVEATKRASESFNAAARLLEQHGLGTAYHVSAIFLHLDKLGVDFSSGGAEEEDLCRFLRRVLKFAVNHILRALKYRARIPVPNAWTLVGVADEWNFLKEGEIYACAQETNGRIEYMEGDIMISRSPTVHPGDARMVRAVGQLPPTAPSGLRGLRNCVVFSCQGEMSLPSMLAGGDLDGDIYCLVKDRRLHFRENHVSGDYTAAEWAMIDRPSTADDVADFVTNYIKNDLLGLIAHQLLLTADISDACMDDPDCLKLANLASNAVDFPKTGRPVQFSELPRSKSKIKPDWSASEVSEGDKRFYPSQRHIGHLYRAVKLPAVPEAKKVAKRQKQNIQEQRELEVTQVLESPMVNSDLISRLLRRKMSEIYAINVDDFEFDTRAVIREMLDIHSQYSWELAYMCKTHSLSSSTPLSEEEVVAGSIVAKSSQPRLRQDETTAMRRTSTDLCTEIRTQIEGDEGTEYEVSILRAWTAWRVSLALGDTFGARSFGLMALEVAFYMMRKIDTEDTVYY